MLQTSPMRLDPEAFAGTMDRENLSLLHGCLLREVTLGPCPHCGAAAGATGPHRACLPRGAPPHSLPLAASGNRLILVMGSLWKLVEVPRPNVLRLITENGITEDGKGDARGVKVLTASHSGCVTLEQVT